MKEKILNRLLTVKSIVTIFLTLAFIAMFIRNGDVPQSFLVIYSTVIAFYFGTQKIKEDSQIE